MIDRPKVPCGNVSLRSRGRDVDGKILDGGSTSAHLSSLGHTYSTTPEEGIIELCRLFNMRMWPVTEVEPVLDTATVLGGNGKQRPSRSILISSTSHAQSGTRI